MRSTGSPFTPLAFVLLATAGLVTTALASQTPMKAPAQLDVRAQALYPAAQSRAEGDEAMDGAVAAAVIGAVSTEFGERRVEVKLDRVAVQPASLRDRNVSGEGRIRIGDEAGDESRWIRFQFHALYDTRAASVSAPALVLGDHSRATVALDSPIARALGNRVDAALGDEFSHQPAQMVIDQVTTAPIGSRYLRVEALGTADFADEGSAGAQVHALYDRRTGQWLRLVYELGTTANWAPEAAIALRWE